MSKILVIEPSRTESLRARLILERGGHQVSLAADGKEGLRKAADEQPELILLDTIMPGLSGFEVCGRLRLDAKTESIPILVVASDSEEIYMPSDAGLDCIVRKPYDPQTLFPKIEAVRSNAKSNGLATQVQNLQSELARAQQALLAAAVARRELLANVSHELRTPLHEIIGMTELLLGTELTTEQQNYINTAKSSSNALLSLVDDVIQFSELEAGQLKLEDKEFDLAEPIERVLEVMNTRATDKGIVLNTSIASAVPRALRGDPTRLRQILSSLVANAIKFTERGEVSVHAQLEGLHNHSAELHFSVSDTGVGIPEDQRESIFSPFSQSDMSATRRFQGMGMGLALAKQLVNLMGGRIWVDSVVGQGSTFHFIVTLKRAAQAVQVAKIEIPPLRVLVAEDSPTNQLIARSSLKKAGHTATIAPNGWEAVKTFEAARDDQFDLILMDVSMPEMDGLEATRRIRELEKTLGSHIPIVAMTAFATKEYQDQCFASGMDAYVTKPVRIDDLNPVIEPLLEKSKRNVPALPEVPPPSQVEIVATPPANLNEVPVVSVPPPVEAVAEVPVNLKEALEVVGDDPDILRDAVSISLEEIPEQLNELKLAVVGQNAGEVEAKAHRLKGIMGNLGGTIAFQCGQSLETMGASGVLSGVEDLVREFEKEIARVVAFYATPGWDANLSG